MHRTRWISPIVGAAIVLSCSDGPSGPEERNEFGSFSAQVTGAVTRSFTGEAVFGTSGSAGPFLLSLADPAGNNQIMVFKVASGRPATGSHTLGDAEAPMYGEIVLDLQGDARTFISGSGTVTINTSMSSRLLGTITFQAAEDGGAGQVNVTAEFDAVCFATTGITCD